MSNATAADKESLMQVATTAPMPMFEAADQPETRPLKAASKIAIFLFFFSGFVDACMRVVGALAGIDFLKDTVPVTFGNAIGAVAVILLGSIFGFRSSLNLKMYMTGFAILSFILLCHMATSPPASSDAWNTIPFENARSISLGLLMFSVFLIEPHQRFNKKLLIMVMLITCSIMVVFAELQSLNILPNFYFQWFEHVHHSRPTGGMQHPHFFAMILVMGMAVAMIGMSGRIISRTTAIFFYAFLAAGVLISTSRVGFISMVVFTAVFLLKYLRPGPLLSAIIFSVIGVSVLGTFVAANWSLFAGLPGMEGAQIFLSAFADSFSSDADDGQFLRGRGERWGHELELITASFGKLMFGYGHQPFVSHNLYLRQLQVSGVVGLIAYLMMMVAVVKQITARAQPAYKPAVWALVTSYVVASITFPLFVSVPLACGFTIIAALVVTGDGRELDIGSARQLRASRTPIAL